MNFARKFAFGTFAILTIAVLTTAGATLLNGFFNCHLSLEGTEAPADVEGGFILVSLGVSCALLAFIFRERKAAMSSLRKWGEVMALLAFAVALPGAIIAVVVRRDAPYHNATAALEAKNAAYFRSLNLTELQNGQKFDILSESIRRDNAEIVRILLQRMEKVPTGVGTSPVLLAGYRANPEIIESLIRYHADFSARNITTEAGILHAIVSGVGDVSRKIASISAVLNAKIAFVDDINKWGTTPLMIASARGETAVMKALHRAGADVKKKDESAQTSLHHACEKSVIYDGVTEAGQLAAVKLLIQWGADAQQENRSHDNCLALAKRSRFETIVTYLTNRK
jgi:ankyrin repeat protein